MENTFSITTKNPNPSDFNRYPDAGPSCLLMENG